MLNTSNELLLQQELSFSDNFFFGKIYDSGGLTQFYLSYPAYYTKRIVTPVKGFFIISVNTEKIVEVPGNCRRS